MIVIVRDVTRAQVLRLEKPVAEGGSWEVDLELGVGYLRTEALKSLVFTTDGTGKVLPEPMEVLVAGAYRTWVQGQVASIWIREEKKPNKNTGDWTRTDIIKNTAGIGSVRAICTHKDSITGVDMVFVTIGTLGIFSGVWDSSKSTIVWGSKSESGPVKTRPLAQAEANGKLFFSSGQYLYMRYDGATPKWYVSFYKHTLILS